MKAGRGYYDLREQLKGSHRIAKVSWATLATR